MPEFPSGHSHCIFFDLATFQFVFLAHFLMFLAASPRSDYKLDVARHLTLSMFYGYSCQKHELPESTSSASSRQEQLYMRFIDLLAKYHTQQREIAFYADKMCLTPNFPSQSVFGKYFKRLTGLSPKDYRRQSLRL